MVWASFEPSQSSTSSACKWQKQSAVNDTSHVKYQISNKLQGLIMLLPFIYSEQFEIMPLLKHFDCSCSSGGSVCRPCEYVVYLHSSIYSPFFPPLLPVICSVPHTLKRNGGGEKLRQKARKEE